MKKNSCLSEQDLILHYYGELATNGEPARHLASCPLCTERFAALGDDLAKLPDFSPEFGPATGVRMAARVNEQLSGKRKSWAPALGVSAAAVFALVITFSIWSPQEEPLQTIQTAQTSIPPSMATMNLHAEMPDIEFIEDLELLKELDLLSQIEGV